VYRRYDIDIIINGKLFNELWIDPHYEEKHNDSINDQLILELVKKIDGWLITMNSRVSGYEFYEADGSFHGKVYRLILVIPPDGAYLGVRNAYRRSK
jgi:hypothetical protein